MNEFLINWMPLYDISGPVLIPLYFCSILAVAVVAEKIWVLNGRLRFSDSLSEDLLTAWRASDRETLAEITDGSGVIPALARRYLAGHTELRENERWLAALLDEGGARISWLSTIATIAPMLGLLGTVTGMIRTFGILHAGGLGDPVKLAGGINEALYTTAIGLVIAVPVYIAYRSIAGAYRQRVQRSSDLLEDLMHTDSRD